MSDKIVIQISEMSRCLLAFVAD